MATSTFTRTQSFGYTGLSEEQLGYWTNTTGSKVVIHSITAYVASGSGEFKKPDYVYGDGKPVTIYFKIGSTYTGSKTISSTVTPYNTASSATTFSLSSPVTVSNGSSVYITVYKSSGGSCLCIGNSDYTPSGKLCYITYTKGYTVTYNLNGGKWPSTAPSTSDLWSLTTSKPTKAASLSYDVSTCDECNSSISSTSISLPLSTWNTNSSGTGTNYAAGASISSNLTLYAIYGNGSCKVTTTKPTVPNDNYVFQSWNTNKSGTGVTYAGGASYSGKGGTLYAVWKPGVKTITLDVIPGSADSSVKLSYNINYKDTLVLPKATGITRYGYSLSNWLREDKKTAVPLGGSFTVLKHETIYANWTANKYNITLVEKDFKTPIRTFIVTYDDLLTGDFTWDCPGYKLLGWSDQKLPVRNPGEAALPIVDNHAYLDKNTYAGWINPHIYVGPDSYTKTNPFKINSTENRKHVIGQDITLYPVLEYSTSTYVYQNNKWNLAMPYIYDGTNWNMALGNIYINNTWKL